MRDPPAPARTAGDLWCPRMPQQVSGWSLAEWQYCGEHPFWRLSCTNPHANSEVFPPEAETVPDGVTRCPCPGAHQKPDPSGAPFG